MCRGNSTATDSHIQQMLPLIYLYHRPLNIIYMQHSLYAHIQCRCMHTHILHISLLELVSDIVTPYLHPCLNYAIHLSTTQLYVAHVMFLFLLLFYGGDLYNLWLVNVWHKRHHNVAGYGRPHGMAVKELQTNIKLNSSYPVAV